MASLDDADNCQDCFFVVVWKKILKKEKLKVGIYTAQLNYN